MREGETEGSGQHGKAGLRGTGGGMRADLVVVTVVVDDVDRLDHVDVLERDSDAELCGHLLLVLLLALAHPLGSELLDRVDDPAALGRALDQPNGPTSTRPEHTPPLSVLLAQVRLRGVRERRRRVVMVERGREVGRGRGPAKRRRMRLRGRLGGKGRKPARLESACSGRRRDSWRVDWTCLCRR